MNNGKKKYNKKAIIATLLFHIAVLLSLWYFGFTTPLPLPEEEGVVVNLGFTDQGTGTRTPLHSSPPAPQPTPQTEQASAPAEDIATQSHTESVALPAEREQREQQTQESPREQEPQEVREPEPEPEPEPQVDERALFPGRDRRSTDSQSQGETGQQGDQGRPDGSADGTAFQGGGRGNGIQFSLSGRNANYLPLPEYTSQAQGRVVVSITVNRQGEITRATAGARGTTTSDQTLWRLAEEAAKRARFDVKNDAPHEQSGTITYNFIRLN